MADDHAIFSVQQTIKLGMFVFELLDVFITIDYGRASIPHF